MPIILYGLMTACMNDFESNRLHSQGDLMIFISTKLTWDWKVKSGIFLAHNITSSDNSYQEGDFCKTDDRCWEGLLGVLVALLSSSNSNLH